jgi:DNA-binding response OmpR family regulator
MTEVTLIGGSRESREVLRALLRLHRFRVREDGRGLKDAKKLLDSGVEGVLLVDSDLADGSWEEVLAAAQSAKPRPRTVLLSPFYGTEFEAKARRQGADATVMRPFEIPELLEALKTEEPSPRA